MRWLVVALVLLAGAAWAGFDNRGLAKTTIGPTPPATCTPVDKHVDDVAPFRVCYCVAADNFQCAALSAP